MYRAHSKDINRNKSFHPLTYGNLRRVEVLQEKAELDKDKAAERLKELQRDQDERRYDALVLEHSADALSGALARFRQTRSVFAAEYAAEATGAVPSVPTSSSTDAVGELQATSTGASTPAHKFLNKFRKEDTMAAPSSLVKTEARGDHGSGGAHSATVPTEADPSARKRLRDEDASASATTAAAATSSGSEVTGFVTTAEAAQLRREVNLAQKRRHDPLLRVAEYRNSCVAAAAAAAQQREQHAQQTRAESRQDGDDGNKDKLQSRIRELLALKRKK
ncbi:hypothetical protein NESM_000680100 [Novymonas esmeraldas]|uniref:CBF1-interacting co-repressor CIR N-terminal domain-containing protein n=1 Tax=Novymonas esmeraldas TaxID=1808958 RepID=A0AAW0EW74_9TRYP